MAASKHHPSDPPPTSETAGRLRQFDLGITDGSSPPKGDNTSDTGRGRLKASGSEPAAPVIADVLRRARNHQRLSLRQVEQRIGISNAHLSQIERGIIRRPDVSLLMELAELYALDYRLLAEWSGYLDPDVAHGSGKMAGMALRLFTALDPVQQGHALDLLEQLRHAATSQQPPIPRAHDHP